MNGLIKQRMRAPNNDQAWGEEARDRGKSMEELNSKSLETGRTWRGMSGWGEDSWSVEGRGSEIRRKKQTQKGETEEIYHLSDKHLSARPEWEIMK